MPIPTQISSTWEFLNGEVIWLLDRAAASYEAGVLTVRVPKAEAAKPRQISVKSA